MPGPKVVEIDSVIADAMATWDERRADALTRATDDFNAATAKVRQRFRREKRELLLGLASTLNIPIDELIDDYGLDVPMREAGKMWLRRHDAS